MYTIGLKCISVLYMILSIENDKYNCQSRTGRFVYCILTFENDKYNCQSRVRNIEYCNLRLTISLYKLQTNLTRGRAKWRLILAERYFFLYIWLETCTRTYLSVTYLSQKVKKKVYIRRRAGQVYVLPSLQIILGGPVAAAI